MAQYAWLIPLLPLISFALIAFGLRRSPAASGWVTALAVLGSLILSLSIFAQALGGGCVQSVCIDQSYDWIPLVGSPSLAIGIRVDALTALMLVVVTSVSFLVQVYSTGYMRHGADDDPVETNGYARSYARYFASMSLFTFSMLGLVLANSLLTIYLFWEGVGLCSYLLIGHWHWRPEAAAAAKKAFLVTRLGDFGFLLGILYLFSQAHTFQFDQLAQMAASGLIGGTALTIAMLLIFCGAAGKSAQFPLHVWLPDAMEGPTPVSALIHAATMVAAGVYLMARVFPLLVHSDLALQIVATIGAFTAIFAASMGLVATDIKRVMAYSTISQLGYMMLGIGVGAATAGVFHLFNHAFFKALLFLGAGSVIHLVNSNEMFASMGGLRRYRPVTMLTMWIAALSLAGIPPFSGFWSKDEILAAAATRAMPLYLAALVTVFMTAFYMGRVMFVTFYGEFRGDRHTLEHDHGEPMSMTIPLIILAIPSLFTGLWGAPFLGSGFAAFIEGPGAPEVATRLDVVVLSSALAFLGGLLSWGMYGRGSFTIPERLTAQLSWPHHVLMDRYHLDHLYNWIASRVVLGLAWLAGQFDTLIVDGAVNGIGARTVQLGSVLRRLQTGQVQTYGWVLFAGAVFLALLVALPIVTAGHL
ncbi:MAG: NADH-quinone oxidoreductase subunit [Chloroflexota bacterium]|jgi:NADH-quinone oxidoreductase subunit L|nr:NADH-quinone oxidoreductase subunit [Chloroflexota bacterium]